MWITYRAQGNLTSYCPKLKYNIYNDMKQINAANPQITIGVTSKLVFAFVDQLLH